MKYYLFILSVIVASCSKQTVKENYVAPQKSASASKVAEVESTNNLNLTSASTAAYKKYTIQKGAHYCDQSTLKIVSGSVMNFVVKFDNSAMYPSVITDYNHALDANKLFGFSEGLNNQYNSARIGWRWIDNELQLLAYVYVKGTLLRDPVTYDVPFIKSVPINTDINCSIAVSRSNYIFTVDGVVVKTPRGTNESKYNGFQQYPYFGGSQTAPFLITINIK